MVGRVDMILPGLGVPRVRSNAHEAAAARVAVVLALATFFLLAASPASATTFRNANSSKSTYPSSLSLLNFLNTGTVRSTDAFLIQPITSIYNEGYTYMGAGHSSWTSLGSKTFS